MGEVQLGYDLAETEWLRFWVVIVYVYRLRCSISKNIGSTRL